MNKKIIIVFWVIVIAIVFILKINKVVSPSENLPTAEINGYVFNIDIADDIEEMKQGLSGREALAENQGMLFIYKKKTPVSFWMKDMKFNIDLLWIDGDKVVGFSELETFFKHNWLIIALAILFIILLLWFINRKKPLPADTPQPPVNTSWNDIVSMESEEESNAALMIRNYWFGRHYGMIDPAW